MAKTEKKMTASTNGRGLRKFREGEVVSNKMQKTVVVEVVRQIRHARFGKYINRSKRFLVHDGEGICQLGDLVRITEIPPMSRHKNWKISEVIRKAS